MTNYPPWFQRVVDRQCPGWWPWPWLCINRLPFWAMVTGVVIGGLLSWYLNYTPPPWLEIREVRAIYVAGTSAITVTGEYKARKTCSRTAERGLPASADDPLVWRQEVTGSGPEIVQYAPRPAPPVLELGVHQFKSLIPLQRGISPDGWKVAVLVSCGTEAYAVRSRSVPVEFVSPRKGAHM